MAQLCEQLGILQTDCGGELFQLAQRSEFLSQATGCMQKVRIVEADQCVLNTFEEPQPTPEFTISYQTSEISDQGIGSNTTLDEQTDKMSDLMNPNLKAGHTYIRRAVLRAAFVVVDRMDKYKVLTTLHKKQTFVDAAARVVTCIMDNAITAVNNIGSPTMNLCNRKQNSTAGMPSSSQHNVGSVGS